MRPAAEETENGSKSDSRELTEELGTIGTKTVDGNKIKAPVEKVDIISEDAVRLWFRFPNGKYLSEEFEKAFPWNTYDYKLARIIDYVPEVRASNFSDLTKPTGPELLLEEEEISKPSDNELEELKTVAPGPLYIEDQIEESQSSTVTTWRTVDPTELVGDERYIRPDDREEESLPDWCEVGLSHFIPKGKLGFKVGAIMMVLYLLITFVL